MEIYRKEVVQKKDIEQIFKEQKNKIEEEKLYKYQIPDVDKDSISCSFVIFIN